MPKVQDTKQAWTPETNKQLNTYRASGMAEFGDDVPTMAITSTNIEVFANGMRVGFVQSFSPSESRPIIKVQELGTEGVVQSVPSNTQGGQLSIARFAVYNGNLFNAIGGTTTGKFMDADLSYSNNHNRGEHGIFSNPFKTLKDQRVPLEFKVKTIMPTGTSDVPQYYVETYLDCWLSSYSRTIAANTITITENATVQYSDVVSELV